MKQDILKVKDAVLNVLSRDPITRSNDKWLIIEVIRELGFEIYIPYERLIDMPSFESITRCRRKLQEQGNYRADPEVTGTRGMEQEEMKSIGDWFK